MSIDGELYGCNDTIGFDILHNGDWIHADYVAVPKIIADHSMSDPDVIKEGWSVPKLWCLWWVFVAVSVIVSTLLSFVIWRHKKPTSNQINSTATDAGNAEF